MKKTQITLFLFFCGFALTAQSISELPAYSFPFNMSGGQVKEFDNRYEGVKGSYTLLENYEQGDVLIKKNLYQNVFLNYDGLNGNVLVKKDANSDAFIMRKNMVDQFTIRENGQTYTFVKKTWDNAEEFFLKVAEGKIAVYCKVSKKINRGKDQSAFDHLSAKKYDEFVTVNIYYIQKADGEMQEIQKSKRGILKALPEKEKEISELLKGNKLDFDDYTQMTLLFNDINGLY